MQIQFTLFSRLTNLRYQFLQYLIISLLSLFTLPAYALVNGGVVDGAISFAGEQDSYQFSMSAGENFQMRITDVADGLTPRLTLYDPSGNYTGYNQGGKVAQINHAAAHTGTYTVVVSDWSAGHLGTGPYKIYFARVPGANDGGNLVASQQVPGTLEIGELDTYTFDINAGENIQIRVADNVQNDFVPRLTLYDPSGKYVGYNQGATVARISHAAKESGTYSLVLSDWSSGFDAEADYTLHFAHLPSANDGGALNSGDITQGFMELGGVDTYTFEVNAGENVQIRIADDLQDDFVPRFTLYDPDGKYVGYNQGATVARISHAAAHTGTYSLVVTDWSSGFDATAPYSIHFIRAPGATDGGTLVGGNTDTGSMTLGDLDAFTFEADENEWIQITVNDTGGTDFVPRITLYDPTGKYTGYRQGNSFVVNYLSRTAGTHTAIISDWSPGFDGEGNYSIGFVGEAPESIVILTHGFQPGADVSDIVQPRLPELKAAVEQRLEASGLLGSTQVFEFKWEEAFTPLLNYLYSYYSTQHRGIELGQQLQSMINAYRNYSGDPLYNPKLHFIGHSLGTMVNTYAINYMYNNPGGAPGVSVEQMTILDEPLTIVSPDISAISSRYFFYDKLPEGSVLAVDNYYAESTVIGLGIPFGEPIPGTFPCMDGPLPLPGEPIVDVCQGEQFPGSDHLTIHTIDYPNRVLSPQWVSPALAVWQPEILWSAENILAQLLITTAIIQFGDAPWADPVYTLGQVEILSDGTYRLSTSSPAAIYRNLTFPDSIYELNFEVTYADTSVPAQLQLYFDGNVIWQQQLPDPAITTTTAVTVPMGVFAGQTGELRWEINNLSATQAIVELQHIEFKTVE